MWIKESEETRNFGEMVKESQLKCFQKKKKQLSFFPSINL